MLFLFLHIPFESKLSTVSVKTKTPFGVLVFCLIVELAGVEPASRHNGHMLSTCLVLLDCRDQSAAEQPKRSLVPVFSSSGRNYLQTSPVLRAPPYRVGSGPYRPGSVSSRHMCLEILPFGRGA
jgi:hypothetical protein